MDYENETRAAYRSPERAAAYKRYHTTDRSWALIATRLEQRLIRRMLSAHDWSAADTMLDVPCGTGILGPTVARVPASIVASDISAEMMALAATEYDAGR